MRSDNSVFFFFFCESFLLLTGASYLVAFLRILKSEVIFFVIWDFLEEALKHGFKVPKTSDSRRLMYSVFKQTKEEVEGKMLLVSNSFD